jgi:hypothetical protein
VDEGRSGRIDYYAPGAQPRPQLRFSAPIRVIAAGEAFLIIGGSGLHRRVYATADPTTVTSRKPTAEFLVKRMTFQFVSSPILT